MLAGCAWNRTLVTTPEISTAAAEPPQEVGVFRFARGDEAAVGEHHVGFEQIVDGEPILAGAEPSEVADGAALWAKRKSEVSPAACTDFYRSITGHLDEPALT